MLLPGQVIIMATMSELIILVYCTDDFFSYLILSRVGIQLCCRWIVDICYRFPDMSKLPKLTKIY